MLSWRYRTDDQFWFTFFHEAGHLILHGPDALFLEDGADVAGSEEDEANAFAANVLVPPEHQAALTTASRSARAIILLSKELGVSPGIVVGQLQHSGRVRRDHLNGLKRIYDWKICT